MTTNNSPAETEVALLIRAHFKTKHRFISDSQGTILPLGESGFQARRGQCGLRNRAILNARKPHPAATASDLPTEVVQLLKIGMPRFTKTHRIHSTLARLVCSCLAGSSDEWIRRITLTPGRSAWPRRMKGRKKPDHFAKPHKKTPGFVVQIPEGLFVSLHNTQFHPLIVLRNQTEEACLMSAISSWKKKYSWRAGLAC
jgi:hypothetical protein